MTAFGVVMALCGGLALAEAGAPDWCFYAVGVALTAAVTFRIVIPPGTRTLSLHF